MATSYPQWHVEDSGNNSRRPVADEVSKLHEQPHQVKESASFNHTRRIVCQLKKFHQSARRTRSIAPTAFRVEPRRSARHRGAAGAGPAGDQGGTERRGAAAEAGPSNPGGSDQRSTAAARTLATTLPPVTKRKPQRPRRG